MNPKSHQITKRFSRAISEIVEALGQTAGKIEQHPDADASTELYQMHRAIEESLMLLRVDIERITGRKEN